jgi:PGF-CTERM protein
MQFPLLGNVFPISHTVRAMRNKSIPSILSATLLIAILMAPLASADSGDETITVNHVVLVDTPQYKEWSWNYSYQTEVNDLQMNVSYTAVILIKQIGDDEWGGLDWWWDDIESDGDQYDFTFSLQRGCYFINASLHESDDLNSDVENATVLAGADLDFVVGTGTCVDGVYSDEVPQGGSGPQDGADDDDAGGLPGFGVILSITAALGAALIATRRE